jgi:nitroimidazol reductase NimA-like FMN-containing flavoprotein (pyridoxamine 5'-phosphate oxidase superfamily)
MGSNSPVLEVPEHILDYLGEQPTLTLATASPTGVPRATTLIYVNEGPTVYVWTRPETATARHMEQNPVVSFAIDEYTPDFRGTKGIQGTGEAQVVLNPSEVRRTKELFESKYPSLGGALSANISFFRISPSELQFIDNTAAEGKDTGHGGVAFNRDLVYSVFRDLPEGEAATLAAQLNTVEVEPGAVIVRQGAPADKFFIIIDGEVEIVREDDGKQRTLATLSRGQFFGEMAILRNSPRMATAKAVGPTTLFAMERDAFQNLVAGSMGTTQDFDRVIQQRLEEIRTP